jgi:hypothetical protein
MQLAEATEEQLITKDIHIFGSSNDAVSSN